MTEHLELQHLKSFAARVHLAIHIGSRKKYAPVDNINKALETVTNDLEHHRYTSLKDAFVALQREVDRKLNLDSDILSSDLIHQLEKLKVSLEKSSCDNCVAAHQLGEHCLPNEKTFLKVSTGGTCIQPVKALCSEIYNWVKTDVCWPGSGPAAPTITLATTHRAFQRQPEIVRRFAVGGWASVVRGKEPNTAVGIDVREHAFGWEQYCLLPYLLLHEILCHGLQSLDGGLRNNADADCAWSEGWMDRLAYQLARQWLSKAGCWIESYDDRDIAVKQSIELHEARYELEATSLGPRYGREVFDKVQSSYGPLLEKLPLSKHPITRLSLRLNACTLTKDERLTLLQLFDELALANPTRLQAACARFIAHPNLAALRAELG